METYQFVSYIYDRKMCPVKKFGVIRYLKGLSHAQNKPRRSKFLFFSHEEFNFFF